MSWAQRLKHATRSKAPRGEIGDEGAPDRQHEAQFPAAVLAVVAALAFSQNGRTDDFALDVSRGIIDGHICHNTSWAYSSCGRKIRLANYLG